MPGAGSPRSRLRWRCQRSVPPAVARADSGQLQSTAMTDNLFQGLWRSVTSAK